MDTGGHGPHSMRSTRPEMRRNGFRLLIAAAALCCATAARADVVTCLSDGSVDGAIAALQAHPSAHASHAHRAALAHTAATAHTEAIAAHVAHRRHALARHHRLTHGAALSTNQLPVRHDPAPALPRHPHGRHKATLPTLAHATRHAQGKAGSRSLGIAAAGGTLLALDVRPLDERQNLEPDAREHPVTSGRGPPRGSPHGPPRLTLLPPVFFARLRSRSRAHSRASARPEFPSSHLAPLVATDVSVARRPFRSIVSLLTEVGLEPPPRRSPRGRDGVLLHALDWR